MLITYRGIVRGNSVHIENGLRLPEGAEVIVVAHQLPSIEQQEQRWAAMSPQEWRGPFDNYLTLINEVPADEDIDSLTDDELVALVHEARHSK